MSFHAALECIAKSCPIRLCRGTRVTFYPGEMNFPRFTAWLGANSSAGKQRRIVSEINTKLLAAGVVCDKRALRLQYLPTLRIVLTQPLMTQGAEGIEDTVDMMRSYLISRCACFHVHRCTSGVGRMYRIVWTCCVPVVLSEGLS
jgi:replication factor C subunit 1